jgi:hypothetical protein
MKKYIVTLSQEERQQLRAVLKKGKAAARTRPHAQILLHADTTAEQWTDEAISTALDVHPTTVANVRQRCVEEGVEAALQRRRGRIQHRRKLDGKQERPISLRWPVAIPPTGKPAGVYACWLTTWSSCSSSTRFRMRRCARC